MLKKLVDPGEEFPNEEKPILRVEEFKRVFRILNVESIEKGERNWDRFQNEKLIRSLKVLAYYIIDEPEVKLLFEQASMILSRDVEKG